MLSAVNLPPPCSPDSQLAGPPSPHLRTYIMDDPIPKVSKCHMVKGDLMITGLKLSFLVCKIIFYEREHMQRENPIKLRKSLNAEMKYTNE